MHHAVLRMTSKLSTENVYKKKSTAGDTDIKPVSNESWTSILLHKHVFLFIFSIVYLPLCANLCHFWPKMAKIEIFTLNLRPLNALKTIFCPPLNLACLKSWKNHRPFNFSKITQMWPNGRSCTNPSGPALLCRFRPGPSSLGLPYPAWPCIALRWPFRSCPVLLNTDRMVPNRDV